MNTVTEIRMSNGLHGLVRESPKRAIKNVSYTHLPLMPPSLMGSNIVVEHSPNRHQVVEHRVTRSPLREVFV